MTNAGIIGAVEDIKGDVFYIVTENGGKLAIYRANVTKKLTAEEWSGLHDGLENVQQKDGIQKKEKKPAIKNEKATTKKPVEKAKKTEKPKTQSKKSEKK
jgi:hypothetical protein